MAAEEAARAVSATDDPPRDEKEAPADVEQGSYELIRGRLDKLGRELGKRTEALNARRLELFGGSEMALLASERIRTENNCVPRDIVRVGDLLLFGYNVFMGLKRETRVDDVLSCHRFLHDAGAGGAEGTSCFEPVTPEFLRDPSFLNDFDELYRYYKSTRLLQLRNFDGELLAIFQIGKKASDIKVLRWALGADGGATYRDNRGDRDHVFAPSHDFEWTPTGREQHVQGRHPHVDILGEVFVETVGGDLTVKVEDNTEDGLGIYREPVIDADQSLDDAEIHYAKLGPLILLKVLPFREEQWRYLVFNTQTKKVDRIDAIGLACQQLPEDHGLIFPGGYYLRSGETKSFDEDIGELEFVRRIRSANGEDTLYVFHHRDSGRYLLLPYNLIRKQVRNLIACHGYALFPNGWMVVFRSTSDEPTRVHAMQVWQTPFLSEEHAAHAAQRTNGGLLERVGNAELVRAISECLSLQRAIAEQKPSVALYEQLIADTVRTLDAYHWLDHEESGELRGILEQIRSTGELVVAEFEKAEAIRTQTGAAVEAAEASLGELLEGLQPESWNDAVAFVDALSALRAQRGHLIGLRELRYVDVERLAGLEQRVLGEISRLSELTVTFLCREDSLRPFEQQMEALDERTEGVATVAEIKPIQQELLQLDEGLKLLVDVASGLEIDDATVRTELLERLSEALGAINRTRALVEQRRRSLRSKEAVGEFGADFKVFGQTVTGALSLADSPEGCDVQLARLMVQLEELEGRYGELDEFLEKLTTRREEVYEAFASRKQQLLDDRQRRAQQLMDSATRILQSIERRMRSFASPDELNTFFSSDPMVAKVRDLSQRLRELGSSVKADELEAALKTAGQEAGRSLRDRQEIYEEGAEVVRLGRHRFSVNSQELDLTLVPREQRGEPQMYLHLTGTDFYERLDDPTFRETRPYWSQSLVSETSSVYRGEYLAACLLGDAEAFRNGLALDALQQALVGGSLLELVRGRAAERYDEGYERGVHDADAAAILERLLSLYTAAGLLRYPPAARALALLYWAFGASDTERGGSAATGVSRKGLELRIRSLARLRATFGPGATHEQLLQELGRDIGQFVACHRLSFDPAPTEAAAAYLFEELSKERPVFVASAGAVALVRQLEDELRGGSQGRQLEEELRQLEGRLGERLQLVRGWLQGFVAHRRAHAQPSGPRDSARFLDEAAALMLTERQLDRRESHAEIGADVTGLLGRHPRIQDGVLHVEIDELLERLDDFRRHRVEGFRCYQGKRHQLLEGARERLRLAEYQPRVLSAFVRNRLINDVYLPLIGDNLAKQIGALGESRRTDLMGLLLLISPPGYGKTTLMEYIANRLGLVFMKINGPALGQGVKSLDPAEAPNATARQEIEKVNLALEMGNNVLLYLDDIQHTSSELLQKFISLCDAQRRIEGVWRGGTRTYDLRGKKFCVCMAGNPYTEFGELFRIPDMLANRADVYNLGDILEGKDELFELSYLENALTSNPVLAPLASRDPEDVYQLVRMARGEEARADQLVHPYSSVELGEILAVLERLLRLQQVLVLVNQAYIYSASQDDAYRTEPRFQLQGSYRNMNRLAEKVVPVMDADELEDLIDDHYLGEAQTLTVGAEHNLLKLRELRGVLTDAEAARWREIKRAFRRAQAMGGGDDDPVTRVTGTLGLLADRLSEIGERISEAAVRAASEQRAPESGSEGNRPAPAQMDLAPYFEQLRGSLEALVARRSEPGAAPFAALDPAVVQAIGDRVAALNRGIEGIGSAIAEATAVASTRRVAGAGVQVVQTLQPGVYDLLDQMSETIDQDLIELLRSITRWLKRLEVEPDKRLADLSDRTLKNMDRFKDLLQALKRIDTTSLGGAEAAKT